MKKHLLYFVLMFLCTLVNAQNNLVPLETTFNFSDPLNLTPSIKPASSGSRVAINDSTFYSDDISMKLYVDGDAITFGAVIETFYNNRNNLNEYYLLLFGSTKAEINCGNGGIINKIELLGDKSSWGGVRDIGDPSGSIDYTNNTWNSNGNAISNILLRNNTPEEATIYGMKIYYSLPTDILCPITISPNTKDTISSFASLALTFDRDIKILSNDGISVTFNGEAKAINNTTVSGSTATITLSEPVETDGNMQVKIPAGTFGSKDGFVNKELTYQYIVKRSRSTLTITANPENGKVLRTLKNNNIKLIFNEVPDTTFKSVELDLEKVGKERRICAIRPDTTSNNTILKLAFENLPTDYEDEITEHGIYKIVIPEKTFYNSKGNDKWEIWNPETIITYEIGEGSILEPKTDININDILESFSKIVLTFDRKIVTYKDTDPVTVNNEKVIPTVDGTVTVTIELENPIVKDGDVLIHIPAGCLVAEDEFSNKNLDYTIKVKTAVSKKKEEAKAFYDKYTNVVGYPTIESTAATTLQAMIAKDAVTVAEIEAAMNAYYKETAVRVPGNNEFYKIVSVNSKNPGDSLYVAYEEGSIVLTEDKGKSATFISSKNSDKVVFKTTDGKYMHVLTAYDLGPTSTKGVTSTKDKYNDLAISKLSIETKEAETFGKVTMNGLIEEGMESMAFVNHKNKTVEKKISTTPEFTEEISSAFVFQATEKPDYFVDIKTEKDPECKLLGANYILNIEFTDSGLELASEGTGKIKIAQGNSVINAEITGRKGKFSANFGDISSGTYTLVIPAKTLKTIVNGELCYNYEFSTVFTAKDVTEDFVQGFKSGTIFLVYDFLYNINYACESINDFAIYIEHNKSYTGEEYLKLYNHADSIYDFRYNPNSGQYENMLVRIDSTYVPGDLVASDKVVKLIDDNGREARTGKFIAAPELSTETTRAIKLVFDDGLIMPKELNRNNYSVVIEAGTFGDANFGKYLEDPNSISPGKCNVNRAFSHTIWIDNDYVYLSPETELIEDNGNYTMNINFTESEDIKLVNSSAEAIIEVKKAIENKDTFEFVKTVVINETDQKNVMTINIEDLEIGDYNAIIPAGTLSATNLYGGVRHNKEISIKFYIATSDISSPIIDNNSVNAAYDIFGRKVSDTSQPGIYIINGKKVIKK